MQMMQKKRKGLKDVGELIFYICLVALPLLQVAIFYVYVNFNSILLSFQKNAIISPTKRKGAKL